MSKAYDVMVAFSEHYIIALTYEGDVTNYSFCSERMCSMCKVKEYCDESLGTYLPLVTQADYQKLTLEYPERLL